MDLNARVNHMDEEMKLLKNEIKQVLIEVQEHVVNLQGPIGGGAAYSLSAPVPARQPEVETVSTASPSGGGAPVILGGGSPGGGQGGGPSGGFGMGGGFSEAPQVPPMGGGFDSFPGSEDNFDDFASLDAGSEAGLASETSEPGLPDSQTSESILDDSEGEGFAGLPPSEAPKQRPVPSKAKAEELAIQSVIDQINEVESQTSEDEEKLPSVEPESSEELEEAEEESDDSWDSSPDSKPAETMLGMDLVSLAGVAQWTQSVLRKIGRERLISLLEVSEMTGRISSQTKETILALIPLFGGDVPENGISVKDIIMLITQLDGFLGATTEGDTKLLPFLLQEDWEVFPLIRP